MKGRPFAKQREAERRRFEAQERVEKFEEQEGGKEVADEEDEAGDPLSGWLASGEEGREPPAAVLRLLTGYFHVSPFPAQACRLGCMVQSALVMNSI